MILHHPMNWPKPVRSVPYLSISDSWSLNFCTQFIATLNPVENPIKSRNGCRWAEEFIYYHEESAGHPPPISEKSFSEQPVVPWTDELCSLRGLTWWWNNKAEPMGTKPNCSEAFFEDNRKTSSKIKSQILQQPLVKYHQKSICIIYIHNS